MKPLLERAAAIRVECPHFTLTAAMRFAEIELEWEKFEKLGIAVFYVIPDEYFEPTLYECEGVNPRTIRYRWDREGGCTIRAACQVGDVTYSDEVSGFLGGDWRFSGYDSDVKANVLSDVKKKLPAFIQRLQEAIR